MSDTSTTAQAAEAICGGLHSSDFEFLGETRSPEGLVTWWRVGADPQDVRVAVIRDAPFVRVTIEWRILKAPPRVVRTKVELRIDCSGERTAKLEDSTVAVVHKCLEIYRDVLQGSGYASAQYLAAKERPKLN